jgi:DNA polymerase-3 subunit delta
MRVQPEQLASQIKQQLSPVYLVHGDEPMLVEETSDLIRQQVRAKGANERQVWHVDGRFDWSQIQWQEHALSLFANQRLIELRLPTGSPGKQGGEALRGFASQPPPDTTLLIISGKIDNRSQKAKWFSELDRVGVTVAIWPVDFAHLPRWINQRMMQKQLQPQAGVAELIAERVEGNLFAAAQEINKLSLLCADGIVDQQIVLESVADNARFQAFGLMDSVLLGQVEKIPRMIERLKAEGLDVLAVFSAVSWSLHRLIDIASQIQQGVAMDRAFASQKPPVWDKQKPILRSAIQRHDYQTWQQFLIELTAIDQAAKGLSSLNPWLLLEQLCLQVAGVELNLKQENSIGH